MTQDEQTSALKKEYNFAFRSFERDIASAKSELMNGIGKRLMSLPSGTRAFWSFAKAAEGNFSKPSFPSLHKAGRSLAHDAKEKADLLCKLFASNSILDDRDYAPPILPQCESSMPEVRFYGPSMRKAFVSLDVHRSSGPDDIPSIVLKTCAQEMESVLALLLYRCRPELLEDSLSSPDP